MYINVICSHVPVESNNPYGHQHSFFKNFLNHDMVSYHTYVWKVWKVNIKAGLWRGVFLQDLRLFL